MFGRNPFNCECGGLRHICARHGHLPESQMHYRRHRHVPVQYEVVWSGTLHRDGATAVQLLGDREERADSRLDAMPTYDLDDGEVVDDRPKRKYNLTGKHVGKFSRTNPNAPHYKPTLPKASADPLEATHG